MDFILLGLNVSCTGGMRLVVECYCHSVFENLTGATIATMATITIYATIATIATMATIATIAIYAPMQL